MADAAREEPPAPVMRDATATVLGAGAPPASLPSPPRRVGVRGEVVGSGCAGGPGSGGGRGEHGARGLGGGGPAALRGLSGAAREAEAKSDADELKRDVDFGEYRCRLSGLGGVAGGCVRRSPRAGDAARPPPPAAERLAALSELSGRRGEASSLRRSRR